MKVVAIDLSVENSKTEIGSKPLARIKTTAASRKIEGYVKIVQIWFV